MTENHFSRAIVLQGNHLFFDNTWYSRIGTPLLAQSETGGEYHASKHSRYSDGEKSGAGLHERLPGGVNAVAGSHETLRRQGSSPGPLASVIPRNQIWA
jgi:hypothetical protein